MKICECSEECGKSQLDLFTTPPTQTVLEDASWDKILPQENFGTGTITFEIPSTQHQYIDLAQTELWVEVSIVNKTTQDALDFNSTTDPPKIAPVNNFLHSLFKQVEVLFNNKSIENSDNLYPYRAYNENLLCYTKEEKETFLKSELFIKDDPSKIGNNKAVKANENDTDYNLSVFKRRDCFKNQPVQLKGRIHSSVLNMNKYLLSNVDVRIRLSRADPKFYLIGELDSAMALITNCFLRVRRVDVSPSLMLHHESMLANNNAKYPFNRIVMNNFVENINSTTVTFPKLHTGTLPKRVILGFCNTAHFDGTLASNPYNFLNLNISSIALRVTSRFAPYSEPLQLNFNQNRGMGQNI